VFAEARLAEQGRLLFPPNITQIKYYQGVRLIMQCADRDYYLKKNNYSLGMYNSLIIKDKENNSVGRLPSEIMETSSFDELFDEDF
jgi:hypothetical protein